MRQHNPRPPASSSRTTTGYSTTSSLRRWTSRVYLNGTSAPRQCITWAFPNGEDDGISTAATCTVPHAGGRIFSQFDESKEVAIKPVADNDFENIDPKDIEGSIPHIIVRKSKYESYLKTLFDDAQVSNILGGEPILKMEDLVNKQFVIMAHLIEQIAGSKGIGFLQNNKKVHKLLSTSDPDVITRFYNTAINPLANTLKRDGINSLEDLKKLEINQITDLLGNLDYNSNAVTNYRDRFDAIQSMIGLIINGKETIARQIAENSQFLLLNRQFLDDFSEFGIHSINSYSPTTKAKIMEKISLNSPDSEIIFEISDRTIDGIVVAYIEAFTVEAFATSKPLNTGTDFIGRLDLSSDKIGEIMQKVKNILPELNDDEIDFVQNFIDGEKFKRRIQIYEMKSINLEKSSLYAGYRKFYSSETGQMLDSGSQFIGRSSDDYKTLISQVNSILGTKYFDFSSIDQFIDYPQFFSRLDEVASPSEYILLRREMVNSFLEANLQERINFLTSDEAGLAGVKLKAMINSLLQFPDDENKEMVHLIVDKISEFIDTHQYLIDVATIEEFLFSNKVKVLDLERLGNNDVILDVTSVRIPVKFGDQNGEIILDEGQSLLRKVNEETVFGFDLIDEAGTSVDVQNNPFIFQEEEIINLLNSDELIKILSNMENNLRTQSVTSFFEPSYGYIEEIKRINDFIAIIDSIGPDYYLRSKPNGEIPFSTELPQAAINYLKQRIQTNLFGNEANGIISQMRKMPFQTTKGIFGSGDDRFITALQRIMEYRYLKTSSYTDLVVSYRGELPFVGNIIPIAVKSDRAFHFSPLMDDFTKGQLMYDNMRLRPSTSGLIPTERSEGFDFDPETLQRALDEQDYENFLNILHSIRYQISEGSAYRYRQPAQIQEVTINGLMLNGEEINGIFLDLSRPIPSPTKSKTTISEVFSDWTENSFVKSPGAEKWKYTLETLEKSYPANSIEYLQAFNEMVYFADRKAKVGSYLAPVFEILDEDSKIIVEQIARQHAKEVADKLKTGCSTSVWPYNVAFTGSRGGIGQSWNFMIKSGEELPENFEFIVNENNVILWYLDAIAQNPARSINLSIVNTKENIHILKYLTLLPNQGTTFKIDNIAVGANKNRYTRAQERIIFENQEGIVRYFANLEKRATDMDFQGLVNARKAYAEHLWISLDNYQVQKIDEIVTNEWFDHITANVLPPNIMRSPSGREIPFDYTDFGKRMDFVPISADTQTLTNYMQKYQMPQDAMEVYQKVRKILYQFMNDIDERTQDAVQYMKRNAIDEWHDEIDQIMKQALQVTKEVLRKIVRIIQTL